MPKGAGIITEGGVRAFIREAKGRVERFKKSTGYKNPTRVDKIADVQVDKFRESGARF